MEVLIRLITAAFFLLFQILLSLSSSPPIQVPLNTSSSPPLHSNKSLPCPPAQSFALLKFKNHFHTDYSWKEGTDCCFWEGVECEKSTGNVIRLFISGFDGQIPTNSSLFQLSHLQTLRLSLNDFNGSPIPSELGRLVNLKELAVMRSNFSANDTFSKMQVLDISSNSLVGHLPSLENLQAMANVVESEGAPTYLGEQFGEASLRNYDYSIALFIKGNKIEMQKIFHAFTSIDLSNNAFEGEIPFDIGKLVLLKGLNLSRNNLKGKIPASIGTLKNLEWLDLSSNKLSGKIPTQLVDVTSLAILNLSDNQLVGRIPEGKQFNTFTIESYKGNSGLCGYPLPRKCRNEESEPPVASIEGEKTCFFSSGFSWQSVGIGYGCGILFGVGAGYTMFRYRRPRWLLLIIENKLRLAPQQKRNRWRRNARKNRKF